MKRSELQSIYKDIVELHIDDLRKELPDIIKNSFHKADSFEDVIGSLILNISANSVAHSVQAVTDVLANVGLLELEDD